MSSPAPKPLGALERYEDAIRAYAQKIAREADDLLGPKLRGSLREEDLRAEGRFAVLEGVTRFAGWGLGEDRWIELRIESRMRALLASVARCVSEFDLS